MLYLLAWAVALNGRNAVLSTSAAQRAPATSMKKDALFNDFLYDGGSPWQRSLDVDQAPTTPAQEGGSSGKVTPTDSGGKRYRAKTQDDALFKSFVYEDRTPLHSALAIQPGASPAQGKGAGSNGKAAPAGPARIGAKAPKETLFKDFVYEDRTPLHNSVAVGKDGKVAPTGRASAGASAGADAKETLFNDFLYENDRAALGQTLGVTNDSPGADDLKAAPARAKGDPLFDTFLYDDPLEEWNP